TPASTRALLRQTAPQACRTTASTPHGAGQQCPPNQPPAALYPSEHTFLQTTPPAAAIPYLRSSARAQTRPARSAFPPETGSKSNSPPGGSNHDQSRGADGGPYASGKTPSSLPELVRAPSPPPSA